MHAQRIQAGGALYEIVKGSYRDAMEAGHTLLVRLVRGAFSCPPATALLLTKPTPHVNFRCPPVPHSQAQVDEEVAARNTAMREKDDAVSPQHCRAAAGCRHRGAGCGRDEARGDERV